MVAAQLTSQIPTLSETRASLICAALMSLGSLALMIYTPALPLAARDFGVTRAEVQFTITIYVIGFTLAHLVYGPLSDSFGRRRVSVVAVLVFTCATAGAWLARDIAVFTALRLLQGSAAAVGSVMCRAIVRDVFGGAMAARILNFVSLAMGLGPALSPVVGGVIVDQVGWRAVFLIMVLYGAGLTWALVRWLPETRQGPARALRIGPMVRQYIVILGDARFFLPTAISALLLSSFYAISTVLPFVLIEEVGLTPTLYGAFLLLQPVSFTSGALASRRLMRTGDLRRFFPLSKAAFILATLALVGLNLWFGPGPLQILLPFTLISFFLALVTPVFWAAPLAHFGHAAGSAAAMFGFVQYGAGALGTAAASLLPVPRVAMWLVPCVMIWAGLILWHAFWPRLADPASVSEVDTAL